MKLNELLNIKYPITLIDGKQYSPTTITVGANTRNKENLRARFSNWGKKVVDVFGPGTEIYATYPGTNQYRFLQGTSMASPAVAGVAALVWSHYPKLKAKDIKFFIDFNMNEYRVDNKLFQDKEFLLQDPDGYLLRFNN